MFIVGEGPRREATTDEIMRLTSSIVDDLEPQEVKPYRRGIKTFARGFFVTDPENMYAVSMSTLQHEPTGRLQRSKIGRLLLGKHDIQACLVVNDLNEPANDREIMAYTKGLVLLQGEVGTRRDIRHKLSVDDVNFINEALTKVMLTYTDSQDLEL